MAIVNQFCSRCGKCIKVDTNRQKNFCSHCGKEINNYVKNTNSIYTNINVTNNTYTSSYTELPKKNSFFDKNIYFILITIFLFLIGILSFIEYARVDHYNDYYLNIYIWTHEQEYTGTYHAKFFDPNTGKTFDSVMSISVFVLICLLFIFCFVCIFLKKNKIINLIESISSIFVSILGIILCVMNFKYILSRINGETINGVENSLGYTLYYDKSYFTGPTLFFISALFLTILTLATIKLIKTIKKVSQKNRTYIN